MQLHMAVFVFIIRPTRSCQLLITSPRWGAAVGGGPPWAEGRRGRWAAVGGGPSCGRRRGGGAEQLIHAHTICTNTSVSHLSDGAAAPSLRTCMAVLNHIGTLLQHGAVC